MYFLKIYINYFDYKNIIFNNKLDLINKIN